MKTIKSVYRSVVPVLLVSLGMVLALTFYGLGVSSAQADEALFEASKKLNVKSLENVPTQHNGRIKPLQTLARESILYLTGKYDPHGVESLQLYWGMMVYPDKVDSAELINVRSPQVRSQLGLENKRRFFATKEISFSGLTDLATPLLEKEQAKANSLNPDEKDMIEVYHQTRLLDAIVSGGHLLQSIDFSFLSNAHAQMAGENPVMGKAREVLDALRAGDAPAFEAKAVELRSVVSAQAVPDLLVSQVKQVDYEVFYNKLRPFFWASVGYFLLSLLLLVPFLKTRVHKKYVLALMSIPLLLQGGGFALRVYLTGFAPVTNMYGTMLWVSFGVTLFSLVLLALYNQAILVGSLWIGSGLILLMAEAMPLVLSPDLDPIVAVLRSNYWLTIHVLTITISYAAFTITMVLGNIAIFRSFLYKNDEKFLKMAAHSTYRMVQLGVFLISVGIILGGIWADYSWGRFWGWDPKETWALIADLGFIAILHARHVGWLRDFGLLVASPAAYLLVIMAWYGVNFILASGLHSYGFSSGGTQLVATFVTLQVLMISGALALRYLRRNRERQSV